MQKYSNSSTAEGVPVESALLTRTLSCPVCCTFAKKCYNLAISRRAKISRAALDSLFQNEENILRTLSKQLHGVAVDCTEAALKSDAPFADRSIAAFEVKNLELLEVIHLWCLLSSTLGIFDLSFYYFVKSMKILW